MQTQKNKTVSQVCELVAEKRTVVGSHTFPVRLYEVLSISLACGSRSLSRPDSCVRAGSLGRTGLEPDLPRSDVLDVEGNHPNSPTI